METDQTRYVIGEKEASQISTYCAIARVNKSVLSVSELIHLMSIDATEEDVERAWRDNEALSARYLVRSGYVVEREEWTRSDPVAEEDENRIRAKKNLAVAKEFADSCVHGNIRLFAVSGGNSYQSARRGDDIDFFCVTTADSLWIFMLRSLILARIYRLKKRSPQLCFSYVMDEGKVRAAFEEARDGLFARDALSAEVLAGRSFYRSLLGRADWMSDFFPRMYRYRMNEEESDAGEDPGAAGAVGRPGNRVLNHFLYRTVGTYVRVKAFIANERYRKMRNSLAVFRVRIGRDHCIYESNRYNRLRQMYSSPETDSA
jgi:hypothetical protein